MWKIKRIDCNFSRHNMGPLLRYFVLNINAIGARAYYANWIIIMISLSISILVKMSAMCAIHSFSLLIARTDWCRRWMLVFHRSMCDLLLLLVVVVLLLLFLFSFSNGILKLATLYGLFSFFFLFHSTNASTWSIVLTFVNQSALS